MLNQSKITFLNKSEDEFNLHIEYYLNTFLNESLETEANSNESKVDLISKDKISSCDLNNFRISPVSPNIPFKNMSCNMFENLIKKKKKKTRKVLMGNFLKSNWEKRVVKTKEVVKNKLLSKLNFVNNKKINCFQLGRQVSACSPLINPNYESANNALFPLQSVKRETVFSLKEKRKSLLISDFIEKRNLPRVKSSLFTKTKSGPLPYNDLLKGTVNYNEFTSDIFNKDENFGNERNFNCDIIKEI